MRKKILDAACLLFFLLSLTVMSNIQEEKKPREPFPPETKSSEHSFTPESDEKTAKTAAIAKREIVIVGASFERDDEEGAQARSVRSAAAQEPPSSESEADGNERLVESQGTESTEPERENTETTETAEPEREAPEETGTAEPEREAPEETGITEPERENTETTETAEPEREAPEETGTAEPEREAPEETGITEPEREDPEETGITEPDCESTEAQIPGNRWDIALTEEEIHLLAKILWLESRGEPIEGQQAVVEVIFNRMASEQYPDTLYEVLSQGNPVQFSSWKNRDSAVPAEKEFQSIEDVLTGKTELLRNDTMYFSTFPLTEQVEKKIGGHYFCY